MKIIDIIDYMENHKLTFIMVIGILVCLVLFLYIFSIENTSVKLNKQLNDSILIQWCSKGCGHMMTLVGEVRNRELTEKCLNRCIADAQNK